MQPNLDDLTPKSRAKIVEFLARCMIARIPVFVSEIKRSLEKQKENVKKGVSWTMASNHLPDDTGKCRAIDVALYANYSPDHVSLNWKAEDPQWKTIGVIGEACGLIWGGRWKQKDMGHFEYIE